MRAAGATIRMVKDPDPGWERARYHPVRVMRRDVRSTSCIRMHASRQHASQRRIHTPPLAEEAASRMRRSEVRKEGRRCRRRASARGGPDVGDHDGSARTRHAAAVSQRLRRHLDVASDQLVPRGQDSAQAGVGGHCLDRDGPGSSRRCRRSPRGSRFRGRRNSFTNGAAGVRPSTTGSSGGLLHRGFGSSNATLKTFGSGKCMSRIVALCM